MSSTDKRDQDKQQQDERKRHEEQRQEQKERKDGGQSGNAGQSDHDRNRDTGHSGNR